MTEPLSVARPYAKAAFDYALKAQKVQAWEDFLSLVAVVVKHDRVHTWLGQPHLIAKDKIAGLRNIVGDENWIPGAANFLALMIQRQRLTLLLEVLTLFKVYKSDHERRLPVKVSSAYLLSDAQLSDLTASLEAKLKQKVDLQQALDKSLLGGVLIQSGDLVFDYTIKGRLSRLADAVS